MREKWTTGYHGFVVRATTASRTGRLCSSSIFDPDPIFFSREDYIFYNIYNIL